MSAQGYHRANEPDNKWLNFKATTVATPYKMTRTDLYVRWEGTVMSQVWQSVAMFTMISFFFFIIFQQSVEAHNQEEMDAGDGFWRWCSEDNTKCRPEWFDEHMSALSLVEEDLTNLTTFVLTFFLAQAYGRYEDYYWGCRAIQGRINDLALIVGGNLCHEKMKNDTEMQEWAATFERYLNLAHFLCHRSNSPVLSKKSTVDPADSDGKMTVLLREDILGYKLCTPEEYKALRRAHEIGGPNGPGNTVLVWISMLLDKGVNMDKHYFRDNIDQARMTALNMNFQSKIEALRGAIAKIGFEMQLPVPLAYAHMMQFFVDTICILYPFVGVYQVNTTIIQSTGYHEYDLWASLPFTLFGVFVFSFFYQGLLALAKTFTKPAGLKPVTEVKEGGMCNLTGPGGLFGPKKEIPNAEVTEVHDKAFYIEVRAIMNQTRFGTYLFFHTGSMAPKAIRAVPPPGEGDPDEAPMISVTNGRSERF